MWSHRMGRVSPTMCTWTYFGQRIGIRHEVLARSYCLTDWRGTNKYFGKSYVFEVWSWWVHWVSPIKKKDSIGVRSHRQNAKEIYRGFLVWSYSLADPFFHADILLHRSKNDIVTATKCELKEISRWDIRYLWNVSLTPWDTTKQKDQRDIYR